MQSNNQLIYQDVSEGDELEVLEKNPSTRQLVMYAGASGDYYEIHYDQEFARSRGLPDPIVHGALKSAFLAQLVMDWMGQRGVLKQLNVRYKEMDVIGNPIYCKGVVVNKRVENGDCLVECDVWTENSSGIKTTVGSALISLPRTSEQRVL